MHALTQRLLNGASLSSVMIPDPVLPTNQPAHDETYKMKFIYIDGDRFFAQTSATHRPIRDGISFSINNVFNYSVGYKRQMIVNSPEQKGSAWADISGRYAKFEWKIRDDFELVWQAEEPQSVTALRKAILDGIDLKLAINDEDGNWSILPVDLANLEQESDEFIIRTEIGYVPLAITDKDSLLDNIDFIMSRRSEPSQFLRLNIDSIPAYYACYSNGSYYNYFDEPRDIFRTYNDLRIFARKESFSGGFDTYSIDEVHKPFGQ